MRNRQKMFTGREQQVLTLIVLEAMDTPYIAKTLGLSESYISGVKYGIFNKTGYSTALELAVAYHHGKITLLGEAKQKE